LRSVIVATAWLISLSSASSTRGIGWLPAARAGCAIVLATNSGVGSPSRPRTWAIASSRRP
jgi:hypothetical protein